jgi:hypothetical protein
MTSPSLMRPTNEQKTWNCFALISRTRTRAPGIWIFAVAVSLAMMLKCDAQQPSTTPLTAVPAKSWALECAKDEEQVIQHPGFYLRYLQHEVNQKGDQLRDLIETPGGTVARLIERDGHPLTPEQDAAERARLNATMASPEDFARHVQWSYAPGQPQLPGRSSGEPELVVLDFKPDPKWSAPSMQAELLTGLEGRIWIDARTQRMVHLEAKVFRAVNVGWGFLAHVYPGGSIAMDQIAAGNNRWIVRHMAQQFTVRALLVKDVKQQAISDTSDYRAVPAMSYQDAIKALLDSTLPNR